MLVGFFALAGALASSATANCLHGTTFSPREEGTVAISKFGYTGLQGPLNWAGLDTANSACRTGRTQSPISIDDSIPKAKSAPKVEIASVEEAEFENLGTTLEVVIEGKTTFEGKEFTLKQFHLHTPSEHRIRDEYFPLEMHMVHQAEDESIAVIAVPFQLSEDGSTTSLLTAAIENLADVTSPGTATKTAPLDFTELIRTIEEGPLFQYTGSLTTPPCKEGLTFLVLENPLPLNVKTYNALKNVIKFNARYTQNNLGDDNLLAVSNTVTTKEDGA
ncbi:alpha carbonic anhydrase [Mycena amicta]|nr:alpha carbonic anhydrase [Mycena amicta]